MVRTCKGRIEDMQRMDRWIEGGTGGLSRDGWTEGGGQVDRGETKDTQRRDRGHFGP